MRFARGNPGDTLLNIISAYIDRFVFVVALLASPVLLKHAPFPNSARQQPGRFTAFLGAEYDGVDTIVGVGRVLQDAFLEPLVAGNKSGTCLSG